MLVIALLTGTIFEVDETSVVVDVRGVGYRVAVLGAVLHSLSVGSTVTLRIHHHVTSDGESLFGFTRKDDLHYFMLLLTVPSVGPRTAMNILTIAPPATLAQAVSEGDVKLLTKVSGVGRKTAERILVELKEKIGKVKQREQLGGDLQQDAISALVSIGFTSSQARQAVAKLPVTVASVEDAVREALKQ